MAQPSQSSEVQHLHSISAAKIDFNGHTIKEVHVADGDTVKEGQPLLTIETDQIAAGVDVNATQLETLGLQKELLAKNIKAEEQRAGSERERLTAASRGLESEIAQLRGQIKLQSERLEVTQDDVATGEQLRSKGFMTAVEFRRRQVAAPPRLRARRRVTGVEPPMDQGDEA